MKYIKYYKESLNKDELMDIQEICYEFSDNGIEYEIINKNPNGDDYDGPLQDYKSKNNIDILIDIKTGEYFKIKEWFKENFKRVEYYLKDLGYKVYLQKTFYNSFAVVGCFKLDYISEYYDSNNTPYTPHYGYVSLSIIAKKENKHINESNRFNDFMDIVYDLNDILLDLKDEGINYLMNPMENDKIKWNVLSLYLSGIIEDKKIPFEIYFIISKEQFKENKEVFLRIEDYIKSLPYNLDFGYYLYKSIGDKYAPDCSYLEKFWGNSKKLKLEIFKKPLMN